MPKLTRGFQALLPAMRCTTRSRSIFRRIRQAGAVGSATRYPSIRRTHGPPWPACGAASQRARHGATLRAAVTHLAYYVTARLAYRSKRAQPAPRRRPHPALPETVSSAFSPPLRAAGTIRRIDFDSPGTARPITASRRRSMTRLRSSTHRRMRIPTQRGRRTDKGKDGPASCAFACTTAPLSSESYATRSTARRRRRITGRSGWNYASSKPVMRQRLRDIPPSAAPPPTGAPA